jgi:hypothetical protein
LCQLPHFSLTLTLSLLSLHSPESRGSLDFFINGDLQWGIELVRGGSKIQEHRDRFLPTGKYASLGLRQWIVVDFRTWFADTHHDCDLDNVLTVYFTEDLQSIHSVFFGSERICGQVSLGSFGF